MVWLIVHGPTVFALGTDKSHWYGSDEARARSGRFISTLEDVIAGDAPNHLYLGGKSASDMPALLAHPLWNCSQEFRDLIEELEPGIHEFSPVPVYDKKLENVVAERFLLRVRQCVPTIDPDTSNPEIIHRPSHAPESGDFWLNLALLPLEKYKKAPPLKLSMKFPSDVHLWRDSVRNSYEQVFISDLMKSEMEKRGLFQEKNLAMYPAE
ncbi:imm11 family protein [Ahrensia sp. R2A130]|uniref:imm11 family protein n=1 Tax=Ahrensia sp. R2A130 TaxID=744979 RepID=UPI00058ADEB0|nr:DUF1629 domain-containing protein [Ahrensia sp. R2A130]